MMDYAVIEGSRFNPTNHRVKGDTKYFFCPHCDSKVPIVRNHGGRDTGICKCPSCTRTYTVSR